MSLHQRALTLDATDPLAPLRAEFLFPRAPDGSDALYFAGNSLGLQPRRAREYVLAELDDWARLGVEGHVHGRHPWLPYHELVTEPMARLVGALPSEVVVMNTLTVNLHLLLVSFYRPTRERYRIVIEGGAFPSDRYAVASQARLHGFDPHDAIVTLEPRPGEDLLRTEDIVSSLERLGSSVAVVLLGQVSYLTGQAYDVPAIGAAARSIGARFGLDLAHGAGNLRLSLHDDDVDFACWCSYKYLNSGPGSLGGAFVHARHLGDPSMPRLEGWWGHDKATRFQMPRTFVPIPTAEAWQLSNPPILPLAALRASLELFDRAGPLALRQKSVALTALLEEVLAPHAARAQVLTPRERDARGCQLSMRVTSGARAVVERLGARGVIADAREPDVVRLAPVPLYTRFADLTALGDVLSHVL